MQPVISDPTGELYGFPTYRWHDAPSYLMTRRQLAAAGLRKNGQSPVAEMRRYVGGWLVAYLYDSRQAAPRQPWTPARQAAVETAAAAKRRCGGCGRALDYIPRRGEDCFACTDARRADRPAA